MTQIDSDYQSLITVSCGTELAGEGDKLPVHVVITTSFQFHNGRLECVKCVLC